VAGFAVALLAACGNARADESPAGPRDVPLTAGCATRTSPPAMTVDGTPIPANQQVLDALAERVESTATERYADIYAGVMIVPETDRIRVFRKPGPAFDAWISDTFATDCVEIVDAAHANRDLRALQDRISDDFAYWRSNGVRINSVFAKVDGSAVEVGTQDTERARTELPKRYGADAPIQVVEQAEIRPA
jgi:hypothetical protein